LAMDLNEDYKASDTPEAPARAVHFPDLPA
jgi:hypothetical protein